MTNDFRQRRDEHLRIAILRFLKEDPQYRLNASLLRDACNSIGLSASAEDIEYQLQWLDGQRLVTIDRERNWILATLTSRGHDVATGALIVSGVRRPSPGI